MKTIQITIPTPKSLFKSLGKTATTTINRVKQYELIRKVEVVKEVIKEVPVEQVKTTTIIQTPHLVVGKNNTNKNGVTLTVESLTPERIRTTIDNVQGDYKIGDFYLIEKTQERV